MPEIATTTPTIAKPAATNIRTGDAEPETMLTIRAAEAMSAQRTPDKVRFRPRDDISPELLIFMLSTFF
jgi:hypothetical protein